jgi:hypothetical protein
MMMIIADELKLTFFDAFSAENEKLHLAHRFATNHCDRAFGTVYQTINLNI